MWSELWKIDGEKERGIDLKAINCNKCRKQIEKEMAAEMLKVQYDMYTDVTDNVARMVAALFVGVMHRRGLSKRYIQKYYDEFIMLLTAPAVMGKDIDANEVMNIASEYIDLRKVKCRIESREEYEHRYGIRSRNADR